MMVSASLEETQPMMTSSTWEGGEGGGSDGAHMLEETEPMMVSSTRGEGGGRGAHPLAAQQNNSSAGGLTRASALHTPQFPRSPHSHLQCVPGQLCHSGTGRLGQGILDVGEDVADVDNGHLTDDQLGGGRGGEEGGMLGQVRPSYGGSVDWGGMCVRGEGRGAACLAAHHNTAYPTSLRQRKRENIRLQLRANACTHTSSPPPRRCWCYLTNSQMTSDCLSKDICSVPDRGPLVADAPHCWSGQNGCGAPSSCWP